MSLNNIKTKLQQERGFTIVELLIVVVVIAILAAITIVSYNGITRSANASSAKSTLATTQKKIEAYNAEEGRYPIATTEFTNAAAQAKSYGIALPSGQTNFNTAPTADGTTFKGTGYVQIQACSSAAAPLTASNVTGARITWWEYDRTTPGTQTADIGTCSTTSPARVTNYN